jgi:hypothetical protein
MIARSRRSAHAALVVLSAIVLSGATLAAPAASASSGPAPAVALAPVSAPAVITTPTVHSTSGAGAGAPASLAATPTPPTAPAQVVADTPPVLDEPLLPGPCDGDIDYGEVISCNVTSPSQVRQLDFSAAAQDKVRVRVVVTGGAVNPITSVLLGGSTICTPTFADEFTCPITSTGTHTLKIDANGSGTGSFATTIQRLNNPVGCKDLPSDTDGKTGSIGSAAEIDCYLHTASTGDRYRIRVVETGGTVILNHEVVRPDGTTMCGLNGNTETTCLLDANGEFRILVEDDNGLDQGNYRVELEKFPGPTGCADALFGAARTVRSDDPGTVDCVKFPGAAGDRIRVRGVVSSGTWNPLTDVVGPDGSTVCSVTFADEFTCLLTAGGNHTVFIRDGAGTGAGTGQARMFLQRLNDPDGCKPLSPGVDGKTGSIGTAVEIDCYSHAGSAGDRWRIRVVETGGTTVLNHEVVRPDGSTVCGLNGNTETVCLLDTNGESRILVEDDNGLDQGSYRIVLEKFPGPTGCADALFGASRTMRSDAPGTVDCVRFPGAAGDRIRVRAVVSSGTWNPLTDVVAPDGSTVCSVTFADEFTCLLTTGGNHTVFIRDGAGTGAGTGQARFFLQRLNDPNGCKPLSPGVDGKTGSIGTAVEIDCYSRAATAGDRWRIRVVETGGTSVLNHEVVRPDGSTVCGLNGNTETTCLLDANGEFRILVEDDNGLDQGDYRIVLEKFPGPSGCPTLDFADPSNVEVTKSGGVACVKVTGASGDVLRVRVVPTSGTWNPLTDVTAKDGTTVCSVTFADEFSCTLTAAGTTTIIVRDGAGTGSAIGAADIFVQRLNQPASCANLAYGPDGSTASINAPVEIDCFRHTATAGQRWRIRVVETGGTTVLNHEVVRPDGTTMCGLNQGSYRIVLEKFPGPTGCDTVTVGGPPKTGSMNLAGATVCFTFSGSAGDVIAFSSTSSGAWNPLTEVLRNDGTTVCAATFADTFSCTLTTNGNHTVIIRDGAGTGSSTGNYALELD